MRAWLKTTIALGVTALCSFGLAAPGHAEQRIAYKSAKAGTSYYQMGVELANAIKTGSQGGTILTVEESQGSVQNVMEAAVRQGDYVFTSPPGLVESAMEGKGPFKNRPKESFANIRALFPIPSLTMHFVMRGDQQVDRFSDMAGKTILLGKGSFGATEGEKYIKLFGLEDKIKIASAELGNAADALKNGQIDGFVTAGSFPAPNLVEASASMPVSLVSLTDAQIEQTGRQKQIIPAGTYAGVDKDVATTFLPVEAFTTTAMDEQTAYLLTKTFWQQKAGLGERAPWWKAVTPEMLLKTTVKLHPGAVRYYQEAGLRIPAEMR
ncbi:MAG: TAXI family TRAP transporter solute-binding subunit [Castellaniella sp.]|uniref:TAXI family TRAP transporter solute-binding subunit n=1 Tax=Castellaniella sp. TaxID=1955812 RepID=UPI003A88C116